MISQVLEHYGADLSRVREYGWQDLRCPFADSHSHGDRNKSARVNLEKGAFICNACGAKGDAVHLIMQREGVGYGDACAIAEGITGEKVGRVRRSAKDDAPRPVSKWRQSLFPGALD